MRQLGKVEIPKVERLIRAKRRYDPDDIFCSAIPMPVSSKIIHFGRPERAPRIEPPFTGEPTLEQAFMGSISCIGKNAARML